ncbi:MAG: NAD(P)H-quinone oxidoreductase [Gemmatimonadales bacterium]|nr:MAG: NAD(P)H-quinone oxidoreductase [Gemmatimonadales bacterium]
MTAPRNPDAPLPRVPAIEIPEVGAPEVLRLGARDLPPVPRGHVRVEVAASGVNRADLMQRLGRYPSLEGFPDRWPGLEVAGQVVAVGEGCTLRRPGDRVMAVVGGGGHARHAQLPERDTIRVPDGLGWEAAGSIPEVFLTAWDALEKRGELGAGETLLVHAVGSGVGTAALQLGRHLGARVIGTSRTPEKLEEAARLGLEEGVMSRDRDWASEVLERTGGRGVDVILDLVGGDWAPGNLKVLAPRARWIVVGIPGGREAPLDLRQLMGRRARIEGTVLRARPPEEKTALAREFEDRFLDAFDQGFLRGVPGLVVPPEDVAEAHRRMEANETWGKTLVRWSGPDG